MKDESGAVLVVVLGILALLTVIAVSFVFSTRMSMRASESYMRSVTATDIAEAGLANAIAVLEADKRLRTGDVLDSTSVPTETYDSLRDTWRQKFSAPVVITYDSESPSPEPAFDFSVTAPPIYVTNITPFNTIPPREGVTAKVTSIDPQNNKLYIDFNSPALWVYQDASNRDGIRVYQGSTEFTASLSDTTVKPDEVDLDGDASSFTSNGIDDDGDGQTDEADEARFGNDAVWQNYYDEAGQLLGRYAVLIEDESSKVNVNVAGNLTKLIGTTVNSYAPPASPTSDGYHPSSNEGWSTFEFNLGNGLAITGNEAHNIVMYRNGFPVAATASPTPPSWSYTYPPTPTTDSNRIYVPGQGDIYNTASGAVSDYDDDDNNYNRYFYATDGIDNDGDGEIDEAGEGMYEPEEFRPMRPVRTRPEMASGRALDYDGIDNDSDGFVDETNEGDDQPILTLEQLEDSQGLNLSGFLTGNLTTNFDGSIDSNRERRHFVTTLSNDRNLNAAGRLRTNPNFAPPKQILDAVQSAFEVYGTGDNNGFERTDLRNMQIAANIYDYRDRNNARAEIQDAAGNTFAGVEAVRINEVMVRAATSIYEPEYLLTGGTGWSRVLDTIYQTTTPRIIPGYLQNATGGTADENTNEYSFTLPNPPFTSGGGPGTGALAGLYPFKLRMRVRGYGITSSDPGFEVWINNDGSVPIKVQPSSGINSVFGSNTNGRWATQNLGTLPNNWYVEEAIVWLRGGADNTIMLKKPAPPPSTDQDTVDVDWFYFSQEPDCEWIELVNLGPRTVNVEGWKIVSEYTKYLDYEPPAIKNYYNDRYEATLHVPAPLGADPKNVGIPPIDQVTDPYKKSIYETGLTAPEGNPKYVIFAIDRARPSNGQDYVGSTGYGSTNDIEYTGTFVGGVFRNIRAAAAVQMVYQLNITSSIYTGWIDFFGNEPFNNSSDDVFQYIPYADRENGTVMKNIGVARISLYDDKGRLVDRVTYDAGNVRASFTSLQRRLPMAFGDRLDNSDRFKMRDFRAIVPLGWEAEYTHDDPGEESVQIYSDLNVPADGNYDDWRPQDPAQYVAGNDNETGLSTPTRSNLTDPVSSHYALIKYAPKDELGNPVNDTSFGLGVTIQNNRVLEQADILYLNRTDDYMIVRGTTSTDRPATWLTGDTLRASGADISVIEFIDSGAGISDWDTSITPNQFKLKYGGVKDRYIASPGELALVPFFDEYTATVRYPYDAGDSSLDPENHEVINSDNGQRATIVSLDKNEKSMVLRGKSSTDFVGEWTPGQTVITDPSSSFSTNILYITPGHSVAGDETDHYVLITYSGASGDPVVGDEVTNGTETAVVTAIDSDLATNPKMIIRGTGGYDVSQWASGDYISYAADGATIDTVEELQKTADVRGLADYFSTACIDLEAAGAAFAIHYDNVATENELSPGSVITNGSESAPIVDIDRTNNLLFFALPSDADDWDNGQTITGGASFSTLIASDYDPPSHSSWPAGTNGPDVYTVPVIAPTSASIVLEWDEDDGVLEGTYDLYSVVNYGTNLDSEEAVYIGPVTVQKSSVTGQAIAKVTINNSAAAAATYHFMRAILAPPPFTFGRINVNTASEQVMRGLPGFGQYFYITYVHDLSEINLAVDQTITNSSKTPAETAKLIDFDTDKDRLKLQMKSPATSSIPLPKWATGDSLSNGVGFSSTVLRFDTLPSLIIRARNMGAFESIGDVLKVGEFESDLTPDVFKNISNLVSTRSDAYKIIVVGQGASDANNNGIIEDNEIISEKKIEMIYQR